MSVASDHLVFLSVIGEESIPLLHRGHFGLKLLILGDHGHVAPPRLVGMNALPHHTLLLQLLVYFLELLAHGDHCPLLLDLACAVLDLQHIWSLVSDRRILGAVLRFQHGAWDLQLDLPVTTHWCRRCGFFRRLAVSHL